ncbi:hypothetical protein KPC83_05905 [Collinsella sp. zg1085]|uniref:regulatory iron-sulfur-containing complex subunit RicT n=1 Tax=Collinsella sp. zg1085 TaxID=2844380 RepID=UPI001C0E414E|nr:regulatory iron-sulfur-containing complex subunit RicT [Collinsella sp. zg1085]QWT17371.1 hypothetical protein KPC83_05905 [Collinsella sp. zg1085]
MPIVVPVKFPYAAHELWFDPAGVDIVQADFVVCSTERGTEFGLVTANPFEVSFNELAAPLKPVLRVATEHDLMLADKHARLAEEAMPEFRRLIKQNQLEMKAVAVEYLHGDEKAVFYFSAEDRVDFRQLVRDLAGVFHVRIDMRQIGVRDETRIAGGYATCGQELCCARFGGQFEPVSIRMAKEQDLPLNSSKISGMCGRLMCCLRYEFEAYKDFKHRAPKRNTLIDTPLGKARIQEYNTPREQLILRLETGRVFRVDLSDMVYSDAHDASHACGCHKASQSFESGEQGRACGGACRPNCVTRDIMDKIESPEIQLALAELDRQNGVDMGAGLDHSDRIASAGPTPRAAARRVAFEQDKFATNSATPTRKAQTTTSEAPLAPRARRRQKAADTTLPYQSERAFGSTRSSQQMAFEQGEAPRRRRRHLSADERNEAFRAAAAREHDSSREESGVKTQRQRRHHTRQSQVPSGDMPPRKPAVPSVAEQVADGAVRLVRRRPGDGGGQHTTVSAARGQEGNGGEAAERVSRRRRPRKHITRNAE